MNLYEQQKGKTLDKLPKSNKFNTTEYLVSTKYDGNRIFIVKDKDTVRFFTSDWKEFNLPYNYDELLNNNEDFVLEAELNYGCIGKLGDRPKSAIITTWRTDFNKGLKSRTPGLDVSIRVFDIVFLKEGRVQGLNFTYEQRLAWLGVLKFPSYMKVITTTKLLGYEAIQMAKNHVKDGWEGLMCVEPSSHYTYGKRGNHIVKLKYRKTADLLCIGIEAGEGKYLGMIGSLVLKDSIGRTVKVGSGLDDIDRDKRVMYIGKIIEIEYEQILDTYIQPTFVCVRYDKQLSD